MNANGRAIFVASLVDDDGGSTDLTRASFFRPLREQLAVAIPLHTAPTNGSVQSAAHSRFTANGMKSASNEKREA
jgi:hypothetical protein